MQDTPVKKKKKLALLFLTRAQKTKHFLNGICMIGEEGIQILDKQPTPSGHIQLVTDHDFYAHQ